MISRGPARPRLGPYEIIASIGAGGMSEVYKVCDTRLDRIIAIKGLSQNLSGRPEVQQRFEREARLDIGNEGGSPYLVMEYLDGETVADRLLRGPLRLVI